MKALLFIIFTVLSNIPNINAQYKEPEPSSVGTILINGFIKGTGFICINGNHIITCSHVIDTSKIISFRSASSDKSYPLTFLWQDTGLDIAILYCSQDICANPFFPIQSLASLENEPLYYIGYDDDEKSLKTLKNYSISLDTISECKIINFQGYARDGYSGGPIFNRYGEVIAVLSRRIIKKKLDKKTGSKFELFQYNIGVLIDNFKNKLY